MGRALIQPYAQDTEMSQPHQPTRAITLSRRYPEVPLVGTAATVFDGAGRVLLVQRGHAPRKGSWGLPGGLLDLGERLEEGVRREVHEECAIEIDVGGLVTNFEVLNYDDDGRLEYHYIVVEYWATLRSGEATAADDAEAVAWANPDDLDGYALLPDTLRVIKQAHALWERQGVKPP
jgi:ADP-ribose pyrophosphatase YjhB (NUDIX family)